MAEINVAADPSLGPQPFDGGVHDDGIRDQVQAEDLIRLLICLTALYLPFRERRIGSGVVRGGILPCSAGGGFDDDNPGSQSTLG